MRPPVLDLPQTISLVARKRAAHAPHQSLLVGISGIDGSGKGWLAARLAGALEQAGHSVAVLSADTWLELPGARFGAERPGEHFYDNALRLDDLVHGTLVPLRRVRGIDRTVQAATETGATFQPWRLHLHDIDIVLAEGIFLFKRAYRPVFDLALWVDCSFATALGRAIARAQEHLPPAATVHAYETIYFPAQHRHAERDDPRGTSDAIVWNDTESAGPPAGA